MLLHEFSGLGNRITVMSGDDFGVHDFGDGVVAFHRMAGGRDDLNCMRQYVPPPVLDAGKASSNEPRHVSGQRTETIAPLPGQPGGRGALGD